MLCACKGSSCARRGESVPALSQGGRFFFTPGVCNEIVRALTQRHPESIVDIVARAEALTGGRTPAAGDPSASFVLARAFCYSRDSRFLARLAALAANGEAMPEKGATPSFDQIIVWQAARLVSDLFALHLIPDSGHVAEAKLTEEIRQDCAALRKVRASAGTLARVMAAGAVAMACMSLAGLPDAQARREWGLATLSELIGEYAFPTRPVSLGERSLVAEMYLSLIVLSLAHRLDVPAHVLGGIEALVDSIHQDAEAPAARGGGDLVLNITPFESAASEHAILALGAVLFDRPDLSLGRLGVAEALMWLMGVGGVEEYEALRSEEVLAPV